MSEVHSSLVSGKQITKAVCLLRPLSSGGMGAVWLADHLSLKTQVVVKFMLGGLDSSESARSRFSREAAAAAQVKSPHVVQMFDHGLTDEGVPFIVMEHLEGHDLGDEIKRSGAVDPAKVVVIITQVAKALSKVHGAGLLHRDIKPDNIFLVTGEEDVFVKLLDFGIAKASNTADRGDGSLDGETKTGQIVGTPFYMSPEQVTAQKQIDHRSDLWALGVVAYEALTGQRPYDGPSFGALAVKIATAEPPRPTSVNPNLPPSIDAWFAKACANEPNDRFSSAKELAEALRAAFEGVVSLPATVSSDSGQRGGLEQQKSSSGDQHKVSTGPSGAPPPSPSPTMGLAATALDDSASSRAALGRSEAGVSADRAPTSRSSSVLYGGIAVVLSVVLAFVLFKSFKAPDGDPRPTTSSSAVTSAAPPPPSTVIPSPEPPQHNIAANTQATVDSGAPEVPTVATTQKPTAVKPGPVIKSGGPTAIVPTKPSAEPKPSATPKPTSSLPDLY